MTEIRYNKGLHRFSLLVAVCTFFLLIAGGLVTSTGSGLAVPDWPLSYGQLMPPMVGGIFYEHGHRMVATLVGFLTIILTVWLWKKEERRWLRLLGVAALISVIAQGILGGLTVKFLLPTPISVTHATLAQTFFCLVSAIALFTSAWWMRDPEVQSRNNRSLFLLTLSTVAAIYVQLILGAIMRHTQSGLAVPDFPLAYGQLFPSLSDEAVIGYNDFQIRENLRLFADGSLRSGQIMVHMFHRIWALVVLVLVLWSSRKLWKSSQLKRVRLLALLLPFLTFLQIALGAFTILSRKAIDISTSHVAGGSLVLMVSVLLTLHVARMNGITLPTAFPAFRRKEALA